MLNTPSSRPVSREQFLRQKIAEHNAAVGETKRAKLGINRKPEQGIEYVSWKEGRFQVHSRPSADQIVIVIYGPRRQTLKTIDAAEANEVSYIVGRGDTVGEFRGVSRRPRYRR